MRRMKVESCRVALTHTHFAVTREGLIDHLQRKAHWGVGAAMSLGQDTGVSRRAGRRGRRREHPAATDALFVYLMRNLQDLSRVDLVGV